MLKFNRSTYLRGFILATLMVTVVLVPILSKKTEVGLGAQTVATQEMMKTIEALSGDGFEGRLCGSDGNRLAMDLVIKTLKSLKIEPGAQDGSYEQPFKTIIPQIDKESVFTIGKTDSFTLYEDYNALPYMNGAGIDFQGEMILVGSDLMRVPPEMIKDRLVVVEATRILPDWVAYVQEMGAKGMLCSSDAQLFGGTLPIASQKNISIRGKTGESLFMGYISGPAYISLKETAQSRDLGIIPNVTLKVNMAFPVVKTANVIGILKGNPRADRVLMLSANLDGLGMGPKGQVFSGAAKEAASMASLLEVARILSTEDNLPYRQIVFTFWNGQQQDDAGSEHYLAHPLYPLEKTTLIHLDAIGIPSLAGLQIQSDNTTSSILRDQLYDYAQDMGLTVEKTRQTTSIGSRFVDKDVPTMVLGGSRDETYPEATYGDKPDKLDVAVIEDTVTLVLGYIAKELYPSPLVDYLTPLEVGLLAVVVLAGLVSAPVRRFYGKVVPYAAVVVMLAFLVTIRQSTDVRNIQGTLTTNFSFYLTLKQTVFYLRGLIAPSYYSGQTLGNIVMVIKEASFLSIKLIGASLSLAMIAGLLRGIFESYQAKPINMRSLGTLMLFSIPDVFVVLLGLFGYTYLYRHFPQLGNYPWLKGFLLPVAVLAIIPTIYVSRITAIVVHEELEKDYIRAAKALGYPRKKIFATELLPAVIFRVLDTLPTLMTMLLSNMIIVEYLFNYNGIGYFLLYLYRQQDIQRFVPMAIVLGLIYAIFVRGIQTVGNHFNPAKRGGSR